MSRWIQEYAVLKGIIFLLICVSIHPPVMLTASKNTV